MNPVDRAEDLTAEIIGVLVAEGIDNATATADLLKVPAALHNGPVVVVQPPKLKFLGYAATEATWELFVIAGPPADRLAAWRTIDAVVQALREPMSIDDAEPATFDHPGMQPHAAFVLTFTETI
jgi:hypothetical protein